MKEGTKMDKTVYSYHIPGMYYDHKIDSNPLKDKFTTHTHDMIEINYFISGSARFSVEGNIYKRMPDDILILRPAETHMPLMDRPEPYERVTVHLSNGYLDQICHDSQHLLEPFEDRDLGTNNQYHSNMFPSNHWKNCLLAISESARNSFDETSYINANIIAFLSELNLVYRNRDAKREQSNIDTLTFTIIQYINNHLFDPLSVGGMSERFHISETHLNRLFRKATGTSIWKYITTKRLLAARQKIQDGTAAQTACHECGFGDYSTFFRAYKTKFSISPKEDINTPAN